MVQSWDMSRARDLRQSAGLAEQRVWARLRGGAVEGIKVRRQHDIGRYTVDFACVALRLVIEIDGGVHDHGPQRRRRHVRLVELVAQVLQHGDSVNEFVRAGVVARLKFHVGLHHAHVANKNPGSAASLQVSAWRNMQESTLNS